MIRNVANILEGFIKEERQKLNEYALKHGPTIGSMYEGLSAELLKKSIPESLDLRIAEGFIYDGKGKETGQIDCMLVIGEGEKIPYTDSYKYHVKNVIAVFEVKKNLYSADLKDSFYKLRQVIESYSQYLFESDDPSKKRQVNLFPAYRNFSSMTGITAPEYHFREALNQENLLLYTTLIIEQLSPVCIVLGYNGFKSEYSLREGFYTFLEKEITKAGSGQGFGVPTLPSLVVCDNYSLVKGNGLPYKTLMREGYWDCLMSTTASPVLLILELIYTKLSLHFDIGDPWGVDDELESLNEFLRAKPHARGWEVKYEMRSDEVLKSRVTSHAWAPIELSDAQHNCLTLINLAGGISTNSSAFTQLLSDADMTAQDFIHELISTGVFSYSSDKQEIIRTQEHCYVCVTPDSKIFVGLGNRERFENWITEYSFALQWEFHLNTTSEEKYQGIATRKNDDTSKTIVYGNISKNKDDALSSIKILISKISENL